MKTNEIGGPNLQLGCLGFPFVAAATGAAAAALHRVSAANFLINILFLCATAAAFSLIREFFCCENAMKNVVLSNVLFSVGEYSKLLAPSGG